MLLIPTNPTPEQAAYLASLNPRNEPGRGSGTPAQPRAGSAMERPASETSPGAHLSGGGATMPPPALSESYVAASFGAPWAASITLREMRKGSKK